MVLLDAGEKALYQICACKVGQATIESFLRQKERAAWWTDVREAIQTAGTLLGRRFPSLQDSSQRISQRAIYVVNHLEQAARKVERRSFPTRWDYLMRD